MTTNIFANPLVFDNQSFAKGKQIRNFRIPAQHAPLPDTLSSIGLKQLKASASGQFHADQLSYAFDSLSTNQIVVVDLRLESHGFADGTAMSWYGPRNMENKGLTAAQVKATEESLLQNLSAKPSFEIATITGKQSGYVTSVDIQTIRAHQIQSEQNVSKLQGFDYLRIPVLDRHPPTDADIDHWISAVQSAPQSWYHYHCRAGKGRATTFLVLHDVLINGKQVSINDLLARHGVIGPKDLRDMPTSENKKWKLKPAQERLELVQAFYEYRNSTDFETRTFSEWRQQKTA